MSYFLFQKMENMVVDNTVLGFWLWALGLKR
jgi:hypothetical protein